MILITGGAGYIGSIVTDRLIEEGHEIIIVDDLSTGHIESVNKKAKFIESDLSKESLENIFTWNDIDAVIHMASNTLVGESMTAPNKYLTDNTNNALNLITVMRHHQVNKIIFSSSSNVYGNNWETNFGVPIMEYDAIDPSSPYGESKAMIERILYWMHYIYDIKYITLRYFNAGGATKTRGENHTQETHIIPILIKAAMNNEEFTINGDYHSTVDGTCVRDYVHVCDIANAHALALKKIDDISTRTFNIGTGKGYSNLELVKLVESITQQEIKYKFGPMREGDPAVLVANIANARLHLEWTPQLDIYDIIKSAYEYYKRG